MDNPLSFPKSICAVMSSYHPDEKLGERVALIMAQVDAMVIIDNTASETISPVLSRLTGTPRLFILRNTRNEGSAKALNQGITWAADHGHDWVLTFDQDSIVSPDLISIYKAFLSSPQVQCPIGIVAANHQDPYTGMLGFPLSKAQRNGWAEARTLITSGSFFSIPTFLETGPFREEFFLDWADYEFCLRSRKKGRHHFVHVMPLLIHPIGAKTYHNFLFLKLSTNNHPPFRCYLIGRNLVDVIKHYYLQEPAQAIFFIAILCYKLFSVLLWEGEKHSKIRHLLMGMADGMVGRMNRHWDILEKLQRNK